MQKLFNDTRVLDRIALRDFDLTEDILMENAAAALETSVHDTLHITQTGNTTTDSDVLIVTGSGNNGADGMALARRLVAGSGIKVAVCMIREPASVLCIRQKERAVKAGVTFITELCTTRIIVDCIFGSGFHDTVDQKTARIINQINSMDCFRIACDMPSAGIVRADVTVTMGALKTALYDESKLDYTGTIICARLGIQRELFECGAVPDALLLEATDMQLPIRTQRAVHKGTFGHVAIASGDKQGAAVIAASASFAFGAGLVTIVHAENASQIDGCPFELMQSSSIPEKTAAVALGMGLGSYARYWASWVSDNPTIPAVIDADMCRIAELPQVLNTRTRCDTTKTVLTPHPAEFASMLASCGLGTYVPEEIAEKRLLLTAEFCKKYPRTVLILKGAVPVIGTYDTTLKLYLNPLGAPCLAKAGSGDVLAGLVAALLAQGYSAEKAAIQASLAHTLASRREPCSYGITPFSLIQNIRCL